VDFDVTNELLIRYSVSIRYWRKIYRPTILPGLFMGVKLCNLHFSPNIIQMLKSKRMRWVGNVAHMGKMKKAYKIMVGKPEGKRPLRQPKYWWEGNIKMPVHLREIGWKVWTGFMWLRTETDHKLL
jgi:hypothetical protein